MYWLMEKSRFEFQMHTQLKSDSYDKAVKLPVVYIWASPRAFTRYNGVNTFAFVEKDKEKADRYGFFCQIIAELQ